MTAAKTSHRDELDRLGEFIEECCLIGPEVNGSFTSSNQLYEAYTDFCDDSGYKAVGKSEFGRRLSKRGFTSGRKVINGTKRRGFVGISIGTNGAGTDAQKMYI